MTRNFQNVVMFVTFLKQVDQDVALFSVLGADTSGCIFRKRRWHTAEQHKSWPNLDSGMVFTSKDCTRRPAVRAGAGPAPGGEGSVPAPPDPS